MIEQLYYPLSNREYKRLCKGKRVTKHYHLPLIANTLFVIVWNTERDKLNKEDFDKARTEGISFANVPLNHKDLDAIQEGKGVICHYGSFAVTVLRENLFKKLEKKEWRQKR